MADNHESMAHLGCVVELNGLAEELLLGLVVEHLALLFHRWNERAIVGLRQLNSWEQIGRDSQEERNIIRCEFGQIHVTKGS